MSTILSYVFEDGTEVRSYCEAERSGKPYIKRYREYKYWDSLETPTITPSFVEDRKR